jgi:hypothetical protein
MSSYSFSDEAVRDLEEICNYIAQNNPVLPVNFLMLYVRSVKL